MPRKTLKQIGREVIKEDKKENVAAASSFRLGEAVQFYREGWRFGHVNAVGAKLRAGMVQVEHPTTGMHWIKASDVRTLAAFKAFARALATQIRRGVPAPRPARLSYR